MEDYVLTVAVSLAARAASLASLFPVLASHLLEACLGGLVLLTAVNLWGIAESAKFLMLPMVLFVCALAAAVIVGIVRSHPAAVVGSVQPLPIGETVGVLPILKAFAAGCSARRRGDRQRRPVLPRAEGRTCPARRTDARHPARPDADRPRRADRARAHRAACGGDGARPGHRGLVRQRLGVLRREHRRRARARPGREHRLRRPAGPDEPAG